MVSAGSDPTGGPTVQRLIAPRTFAWLMFGSAGWVTLCITVAWGVPGLLAGGFGLLAVAFVAYGPPFGSLAAGLVLACLWLFRRFVPRAPAVVAAAMVGWSIALGAWMLFIGLSYFDGAALFVTVGVALVGAVFTIVVCWPRRTERSAAPG